MGEARLDAGRFRELLREEHERLEHVRDAVLEETALPTMPEGSALGELSDVDQHPADVGTETFEREKHASILEATERQLADVERAQSRLDDGSYGTCEACGRAIAIERLEARPATRFCLEDQQRAEQEAAARGA